MIIKEDLRVLEIGNTQIFHNDGPLPRLQFDPEAIVGWSDGADVRRDASERPVSDGDFAERGRLSSRLVTITGIAKANNVRELHQMRDEFVGLLSDGGYSEVRLSTGYDDRFMQAGLGGPTSWVQQFDTVAFWKMDLYMPDPRMYGPLKTGQLHSEQDATNSLVYPLTSNGGTSPYMTYGVVTPKTSSTLQNLGNHESWPAFIVTGDFPTGFRLYDPLTARSVTYTGVVTISSPIKIDFASGSAFMVNDPRDTIGIDRSYNLAKREWFSIPKKVGDNAGTLRPKFIPLQESNTGFCDVEWRSTWV